MHGIRNACTTHAHAWRAAHCPCMRCDCDKQVRDVLLDSLVDLCRDPSLLPSMYVNYDCDLEGSNLFERICKFLARSAFPYSGVLTSVHTQSIEGLQAVIAGTAPPRTAQQCVLRVLTGGLRCARH